MSKASARFKKRKKAKEILNDISENTSEFLIIHYSCESFFDSPQGNTPRITSIAIRYVKNSQTLSFSIHKMAELKRIAPTDISQHYNELEKEMLTEYFTFVKNHQTYKWIHLNMRNINFGFEAIKHRYRVLGGEPTNISDHQKIDLAGLFIDLFGKQYINHPRFENLYHKNKITMTAFLNGKMEAEAFREENYIALHQSTLRKVDNMHNVINLAIEDDLKTESNIIQIYGLTPKGIFHSIKDNWILALIVFIISSIVAGLIGYGITSYFN